MESDVTADDFKNGFELAIKLGVFRNNITLIKGEERKFQCPARITLGAVMARDANHVEGRPSHFGAMLGMIHKQIISGKAEPREPLFSKKIIPEKKL